MESSAAADGHNRQSDGPNFSQLHVRNRCTTFISGPTSNHVLKTWPGIWFDYLQSRLDDRKQA